MWTLDMALLRELADEFGCYPASVKPEDIERTRARWLNTTGGVRRRRNDHSPASGLPIVIPTSGVWSKSESESNGSKHFGQ